MNHGLLELAARVADLQRAYNEDCFDTFWCAAFSPEDFMKQAVRGGPGNVAASSMTVKPLLEEAT